MIINYQKMLGFGLTAALFASTALPAFAAPLPGMTWQEYQTLVHRAVNACRKNASTAYTNAVHKANMDYKTANEAASATLKASLAIAQDDAAKMEAQNTYNDAHDAARMKMMAAKKTALTTFKASTVACTLCKQAARIDYAAVVEKANKDFKSARDAARAVFLTAWTDANGDAAQQAEVLHVYKDAVKAAMKVMVTTKEAALVTFRAESKECKMTK